MFMLFVAAGMGLMALAHMAPFPFLLDALARGRSHWEMPRGEGAPRVYLTYDDGPNPTATPALLDVLAREGAVATFFLLDRHLDADTAPIVTTPSTPPCAWYRCCETRGSPSARSAKDPDQNKCAILAAKNARPSLATA